MMLEFFSSVLYSESNLHMVSAFKSFGEVSSIAVG